MKKTSQLQLQLKAITKSNKVLRISTSKKRRFLLKLQAIPSSDVMLYRLRVVYGWITNANGEKVIAQNEGEYIDKNYLLFVFRIFTASEEIKTINAVAKTRMVGTER